MRIRPVVVPAALFALLALPLTACTSLPGMVQSDMPSAADLARAQQVLRESTLIDGHTDLPWAIRTNAAAPHDVEAYDLRTRTPGHTDLERLKAGQLGGQFWSVYVPGDTTTARLGFAKVQLEQIDIARRVIAKYPDVLEAATTAAGFRTAFARGRVGSVIGMEGGHVLENSLGALRAFYDLGARYLTLTHNQTLDWADAPLDWLAHGPGALAAVPDLIAPAARRHGAQVLFTSTGGAIYGECKRPAREDHPRQPLSPYGVAKVFGHFMTIN